MLSCDSESGVRQFRDDLQTELERIDRGEGTVLEGDEALTAFFDQLRAEARAELAAERAAEA